MDCFKFKNNDKATSYDFYCNFVRGNHYKSRKKDKKMLHKLSRSRLKQDLIKELIESER